MDCRFLDRPDGHRIAYRTTTHMNDLTGPGIFFLPGFKSDMRGTKSEALAAACYDARRPFTCMDYYGHGESTGAFTDGTIGRWMSDVCAILDSLPGPQILVGSSMGGWLMVLVAKVRQSRISALVGIAPAPDFTEDLMWPHLSETARSQIMTEGQWDMPSPYDPDDPTPITRRLIEEAKDHLVLTTPIPVTCPVRILQGMSDADVPWHHAIRLQEMLTSKDVLIILSKDKDHRLSDPDSISLLINTVLTL